MNKEIRRKLKEIALFRFIADMRPHEVRFRNNLRLIDQFDREHGTDFGGRMYWDEIGTAIERANDYSPSHDALIKRLREININTSDKIVDLGCGKGYAMYVMSKYPFGKIGGIELSSVLCRVAKKNLSTVIPDQMNYEIVCEDAGKWDGYDEYNFFYIYNSFPKNVVTEVKNKISESVKINPRKVEVWYLNPEFPEVFMNDPVFRLKQRGGMFELRRGMHVFELSGSTGLRNEKEI